MSLIRLIPRLDVKGPNLVKGIHLEGLRVLGHPQAFARFYYEQGADELLYMDVVASLYGRNSLLDLIAQTAREIFIPITVGGGLRSLEDIQAALRAGADKIALNTAALKRPELIREAAERFGSSTIVVSIEAMRHPDGSYEAYTDNGRERTGVSAFQWAIRAAELGAGELLITSIDREGTGKGYDLELTRRIADSVSIPVIACGGAGRIEHVAEVLSAGHANAVCIASLLHYGCASGLARAAEFAGEGNTEFLRNGRPPAFIQPASLPEVREALRASVGLHHRSAREDTTRDKPPPDTSEENAVAPPPASRPPKPFLATARRPLTAVIVDYGMGNLFSVQRACEWAGINAEITSDWREMERAEAVILPGVGAFGDAMATLRRRDLAGALRDAATSGKPFLGICLGVQLLFSESEEFGQHKGLDILPGRVVRLEHPTVPHIGWNRILPPGEASDWKPNSWLRDVTPGTLQYFVHSYVVAPEDAEVVHSVTRYGTVEFCSSVQQGNLFACQFHPERSGLAGLSLYHRFAAQLRAMREEESLGSKVWAA